MKGEIYGTKAHEPVNAAEEDLHQEEIEHLRELFDNELWPKLKNELKEATKKEACFLSFLAGTEISNNMLEKQMEHSLEAIKNMSPKEMQEMLKDCENEENSLWEEGSFVEAVNPNDKDKMRSFHMKPDEEMNYNCKDCNVKISAHNKDWHNHMCYNCFNKKF